ncbi:MAG: hypothetical protein ACHQRM_00765 [Bacteroidia bacterium]
MKKLMHLFMLSCLKVSQLIEKKQVLGLSRMEKMGLAMHLSMCDACTAYQQQSLYMDRILKAHFRGPAINPNTVPLLLDVQAIKSKVLSSLDK